MLPLMSNTTACGGVQLATCADAVCVKNTDPKIIIKTKTITFLNMLLLLQRLKFALPQKARVGIEVTGYVVRVVQLYTL
jgi:hypothetical protein